ncbi:transcription factor bHLH120-like [Rhododendron vialii]|uniref:transcription factor bHLH120-like n=1 Tax=Rhododendron vialii TaxID=182163 RepID=UPI00265F9B0F|nr:transcription factor bHLH120-like [Rhododendron vialii]
MFSLQHGDELVFQISKIEQDLISARASLDSTHLISTPQAGKKKRKKSYSNPQKDKYENNNEKKMIAHRDVERQRRQEMAKLYASLRSLLPAEYVKGKRSVCDHMNESVNYIKQLQENIEQLSMKRDNLKNMFDSIGNNTEATRSSENCFPGRVTVGLCWGGVEILISTSTGSEDEGFPISRVLEILVEEGLDVVSCVSTQINKKLLHVIKSEVSDPTCVDLSMLEEKLADVINGN